MITFFTIVLFVYSLVNIYLFMKGYNAIPALKNNRLLYSVIFFFLGAIFIAAKILESRHSSVITDALNIVGGFWLAFMLYGFLFFLLSDIVLLVLRIPGIIRGENILLFRKYSFLITVSLSVLLIAGGFINALIPRVKEYNITINKSAGDTKTLRIAAASDIHLGSVIRKRSIRKLSSVLQGLETRYCFTSW